MKNIWSKTALISALGLTLILTGCGKSDDVVNGGADFQVKKEIKIGTTPGMFADMVRDSVRPQLEKKGYTVKLIEFTDYVRPNHALAEGDLDINVFQHKPYLDQFKEKNNLELTDLFQVPTAPLGVYPGKLKSLNDLKEGSTVAAANDPSNFSRTLVLLDELGWIKLKEDINPLTASKRDIGENPHELKIVELEAAQLPRSRDDVDFSVITGNYAVDAKIPLTEALFQEPSFNYINWAAIKTKDKDTEWVKDITEAYNSDEFKEYAKVKFAGYKFPAAWAE